MKAILINAKDHSVEEVNIDSSLTSIYKVMDVEMIETAMHLPNGDCVYVDEEGMMKSPMDFFTLKGGHQPFAGNGLVVGTGRNGKTTDCKSTVDDIMIEKIRFLNFFQIKLMIARGEI